MQDPDISRLPDELRMQLAEHYQSGCWNWLGKRNKAGYGFISGTVKRYGLAETAPYRLIYRLLVGEIKPDHHLHHWCGNKRCCNPAHLLPMNRGDHGNWHGERLRRIKETYCRD
jgi:hypothetical protein